MVTRTTIQCDECDTTFSTNGDATLARSLAKKLVGWKRWRLNGVWKDLCAECARGTARSV